MSLTETVGNVWGAIGITIGTLGTLAGVIFSTKSATRKKENETILRLSDKVEKLETNFLNLKTSFTLVCDEMERTNSMPDQLKQFRKLFDL
tara:strand:+ start:645 stop:917 length:273 start_codon:yes stop_codon:yes gene_type:complete